MGVRVDRPTPIYPFNWVSPIVDLDDSISTWKVQERGLAGRLFEGVGDTPYDGVLVLHGAGGGGGYEQTYARYLAAHGYTAFCVEYFGTADSRDTLAEIPMSYFEEAATWLTAQQDVKSERVGVVGFSRGGEAALLVGAHVESVGVVVGYVPSGLAFPSPTWMDGVEEEGASWTVDGEPVPYIPVEEFVETSDEGLEATLEQTEASTPSVIDRATKSPRDRAEIPVERIDGPVLLVSGEQDRVWPSKALADVAFKRLEANDHPWSVRHLSFSEAGHAIRVPYSMKEGADPDSHHRFGGTNGSNARASARAWRETLEYLHRGLRSRGKSGR